MQRESSILEGHLVVDPVHMLICIPPKYSVARVVGFIKSKSAINIARSFLGKKKNFTGHNFWARGYFVSTAGRDENTIREYIKKQKAEDRRLDQLLFRFEGTQLREVLSRYTEQLRTLHKNIKENIADSKLARADRLLYEIEDTFDEFESELD